MIEHKSLSIGNYRHYTYCRFCFHKKIIPVINLGYVPLAGGFVKSNNINEFYFPLVISFCPNCYLLQSENAVDGKILFSHYYYFSSAINTLKDFFQKIALGVKKEWNDPKKRFIVEIGCNDGSLLKALSNLSFKVLGVDPATNVVKSISANKIPIINDFFSEKIAKKIINRYGQADTVMSFNTLAHIEDMHAVMRGIKILLKNDGFLKFGVHYLGGVLKENQYDMIYHEHQYYYSLLSLKNFLNRYGFEIYDALIDPLHGGSIIVSAQHIKGKRKVKKSVNLLLKKELSLGFNKITTYKKFMGSINKSKRELMALIQDLKFKKKSVAGYGASGRSTTLMNFCGIDINTIDYVIDDAPAKQNVLTPGNHLKIISSSVLRTKQRPDYTILFAWAFFDEIKKKNSLYLKHGGSFIIPLPKLKVIKHLSKI